MKRASLLSLILFALLTLTAWTRQDCEAVNYDHPDCDNTATTTSVTYPSTTTTVTTPNDTTTTTVVEVTTTTAPVVTTAPPTTTAPCFDNQQRNEQGECVTVIDTTTTVEISATSVTALVAETLPHTGASLTQLGLGGLAVAVLGYVAVKGSK